MDFITNSLTVAIGLGFVIFIHELGHFLLAKWNGVKVEKFSIGFGPTLFGFRRGETEYVLAAVPLGGFVRMLGEEPEEDSTKAADPRSFANKSVGARMAIMTAGVVMNVILGFGCFVWAYGHGMKEVPAKLGIVLAGSPAYEAGLRAGDEILGIDGRTSNVTYDNMRVRVQLSSAGQKLRFEVLRPGRKEPMNLDIEPRREEGIPYPSMGVLPPRDLSLSKPPFVAPPGLSAPTKEIEDVLEEGDKVVAAGPAGEEPTPVSDLAELRTIMARQRDKPLRVVIEHAAKGESKPSGRFSVTLPPSHYVDFGFRPSIAPIASIQRGSIAEQAGFHVGDRILKINGSSDFDPLQLPDLCFDKAGKPMTFEVERPRSGQPAELVSLSAVPDQTLPALECGDLRLDEPLDIPGLGLAFHVRPRIVAVVAGSPAAKAGLKVGDVINSLTFPQAKSDKKAPEPIVFDDNKTDWSSAFLVLQRAPRGPVVLRVNGSKTPINITPVEEQERFTIDRGFVFDLLIRQLPPMSPMAALEMGFYDTGDKILQIYSMLRSLFLGRISTKTLGGPVLIAKVAYSTADSGFNHFIHFLGMLSINLAVLNFLPVPPLDGGQMVFLAAEKVRGRPLPESFRAAGMYTGLVLVICLMIFVLCQDVIREITGKLF